MRRISAGGLERLETAGLLKTPAALHTLLFPEDWKKIGNAMLFAAKAMVSDNLSRADAYKICLMLLTAKETPYEVNTELPPVLLSVWERFQLIESGMVKSRRAGMGYIYEITMPPGDISKHESILATMRRSAHIGVSGNSIFMSEVSTELAQMPEDRMCRQQAAVREPAAAR